MYITGFHSIEEKVRSQKKNTQAGQSASKAGASSGYKIYFSKPGPRVRKILAAAKEAGITCEQTNDAELDKLVSGLDETLRDHRGIVMEISGAGKQPAANLVDFDSWVKTHSGEAGEEGAVRQTVVILGRLPEILLSLAREIIALAAGFAVLVRVDMEYRADHRVSLGLIILAPGDHHLDRVSVFGQNRRISRIYGIAHKVLAAATP